MTHSNTNSIPSISTQLSFWMKVVIGVIAIAMFTFNYAKAQTNPPAQTLPHTLSSHSSSTLPTGWAAHKVSNGGDIKTTVNGNANQAFSASGFGWNFEGANGLSLMYDRCVGGGCTDNSVAFVLSINTTGLSSVNLSWVYRMIAQGSKDVLMGVQYRVGTTDPFTDAGWGTNYDYASVGKAVPSSQAFSNIALPAAALNQAVVQIRWLYWQTSSGSGTRPRIAIDDIAVCSSVTPTISISANTNPVCSGVSVTYTANITNGGTSPSYQWKVNGGNVGSNSPTYIASRPADDNVTCELTSNIACATVSIVTSNTISVLASVTPSVSISASSNPICPGIAVTFTATPTNGGAGPAYQWKVNGANVGINNFQYTTSSLNPGDTVTCVLTSNAVCASPATATSSGLVVFKAALPYTQNFNSTDCWTISHVGATPAGDWFYVPVMANPTLSPASGTQMAYFNSNSFAAGASSRLMSPRLALNTMSEPYLRVQLSRDAAFPNNKDLTEIYVSTNDGLTWTPKALRAPVRHSASFVTPGWFTFELDLTPFKGSSQVRIAFDAVSAAGNNLAIDEIAILEASCPVPQSRTVTNKTTGGATVSFKPSAGSTAYKIRWTAYADTAGWLPDYTFKNTTDTSFNITTLLPNTKYIWWVSSTCSGSSIGYQCYADTFVTLPGPLPCVKPFNITHTINNGSSVTGHWDNRITADTFKIRYAELGSSAYKYKFLPGNPGSVSSYTMTGLMANTAYYWQVAISCSGVSSSYSLPDTFTTPAAYVSCVKLYGVYSDSVTSNSAVVGWDTLITANEFRVRYWIDTLPVNYKYEVVSGGSAGNYTKYATLTNLLPNTTYKFQIRSQCLGFKSAYSDVEMFTTLPNPTRLSQDNKLEEQLIGNAEIFPNPGNGIFNIQIMSKSDSAIQYDLYDLSGRNLYSGQIQINIGDNIQQMNFEGLAAGTYFLKLNSKEYNHSSRIIIQ